MHVNNRKTFNHINTNINLVELKASTSDGVRYYTSKSGKRYYSVTTVTGFRKSAFFSEWRRKNPQESKRVTSRGTNLHSLIEDYINNKPLEPQGNESLLFKQMLPLINKIDNIHAQEVALCSDLLNLAGRVDCIAEYDGKLSVIDFKGSTREKSLSDISNYFEQATAYAIMWKEATGQSIDQIVILISSEDGTTQEIIDDPVNHVKGLRKTILDFSSVKDQQQPAF